MITEFVAFCVRHFVNSLQEDPRTLFDPMTSNLGRIRRDLRCGVECQESGENRPTSVTLPSATLLQRHRWRVLHTSTSLF